MSLTPHDVVVGPKRMLYGGILRGASKLIASDTIIACELHPYLWSSFGDSWDDLVRMAEEGGRTPLRQRAWLDHRRGGLRDRAAGKGVS